MKKLTIIVTLVLMAMPMMAERVTSETARKVATTFLKYNVAKSAKLTDISNTTVFPHLYIFSTESSFVVVAADDRVSPILGYSLTNRFDTAGMPENITFWLKTYCEEIQYAIDNQIRASAKTAKQWKDLQTSRFATTMATAEVSPLIQTNWAQGSPYNNLCPNGSVTGCVATAMAQVMKYWNYPTIGIGSHDYQFESYGVISADFGSAAYDWDNMTPTYSSSSTSIEKTAVATLMYHCGVSVEMKYSPGESGSTIQRASAGLKTYFNYSTAYIKKKDYDSQKWMDTLKHELNQSRPILYSGNGASGGHAFVCDGYDSNNNFHFNWGWNGGNNGYFPLTSLTPGSYNFNSNQSAVINISPMTDGSRPLTLIIDNTVQGVSLTWTDDGSCDAYNIYRNNALITTTSEMFYFDTNPSYGNNTYYIRGVLADGILTLPSNCVTISIDYQTPIVHTLNAETPDGSIALSWEAPEWCYPATADEETFSYVNEERLNNNDLQYSWREGEFNISWGHRYPVESLTNYDGKAIHEISFFSMYPGAFDIVVYQGTDNGNPVQEVVRKSITTARNGWSRVDFSSPAIIDASKDLWIFVINTDHKVHTIFCKEIPSNNNGSYYAGNGPTHVWGNILDLDVAWLIRAYLTDGTYSYNLYDDGTSIVSNISETSFNVTNPANNAVHQYTVKTNYYDGESDASNMAGVTLGSASLANLTLGSTDMMIVAPNSCLTITDELVNEESYNLIIEDGAQLIHNSDGVKATVKKSIAPYTDNDNGWNFIASPALQEFAPSANNGFLSQSYDLYFYEEPTHMWRNHKEHFVNSENQNTASNFNIEYKKGYLYANSEPTTLQFAGTLSPSSSAVTIGDLSHEASTLTGFNLVGNPFACNATVNQDFYIINNNKIMLAENGSAIAPCDGILVKATADNNASVTFNKATPQKGRETMDYFDIVVVHDKAIIDRARVRIGEGVNLEKFCFDDNHSQINLWQNGKDFSVAYVNSQSEFPLNFKTSENGIYTLNIETGNLDLNYLHLIDNLTGNDVDLLVTPSYTFEAKPRDYATRFKLVFDANAVDGPSTGSGTFAFISDGNIIVTDGLSTISGTCATLQIVDMMGRVVVEGDAMNHVSTSEMAHGVYVLRLINGEKVRTQKIVIE